MKSLLILLVFVLAAGVAVAQPYYVAGDFNVWNADTDMMFDDGTNGDLVAGDGIHSLSLVIATAGRHEYKNATFEWGESWPVDGNNWFITDADDTAVLFTFNTNAMDDGWLPNSHWGYTDHNSASSYVLVGDLGDELGGADWDEAGVLVLHDDGLDGDQTTGDGFFSIMRNSDTTGTFEWKIACNGGWGEQYGINGPGVNCSTWVIDLQIGQVYFLLDATTGRIFWDTESPVETEMVDWNQVKSMYR